MMKAYLHIWLYAMNCINEKTQKWAKWTIGYCIHCQEKLKYVPGQWPPHTSFKSKIASAHRTCLPVTTIVLAGDRSDSLFSSASVLSSSVLNLLLKYSIIWTRANIVAVLAFHYTFSKHYIFVVDQTSCHD